MHHKVRSQFSIQTTFTFPLVGLDHFFLTASWLGLSLSPYGLFSIVPSDHFIFLAFQTPSEQGILNFFLLSPLLYF